MTISLDPDRVPLDCDELAWVVLYIMDHLQQRGHLARLPHVRGVRQLGDEVVLDCDAAHNKAVVAALQDVLVQLEWVEGETGRPLLTWALPQVPVWQVHAWVRECP